jgi:hypothetical protein
MKSWRLPAVEQPMPAAAPAPKKPTVAEMRQMRSIVPSTEAELAKHLADPIWRVCSGQLYKIMVKSPDGDDNSIVAFLPNRAQCRFLAKIWYRNIILKARQRGFTTLIAILWLDHALFNADQRCAIVAQDVGKAEEIFRDKVRLAYDRLPDAVRFAIPLKTARADELLFANNSSVQVATSARGSTIHRLHVSEFGKIGAKYPDKAKEVVTGSLPAVPLDGIAVIESTAEGQDGDFYMMTERAMSIAELGRPLNPREYRFHFEPWWDDDGYRTDPTNIVISDEDQRYFESIEAECRISLDAEQRAWYVATRDNDFGGDPSKMWQEYPSYPKEAFKVSTEGCYYAVQLTAARKQQRIGRFPHVEGSVVNTFWDIGSSDGTGIWFHQQIGAEHRFIRYIEGWGESYAHFIVQMQAMGYVWGIHYLPHDAEHKRQQGNKVAAPIDELRAFKIGGTWEIVPAVDDINHGIMKVRLMFSQYTFDEQGCAKGLAHLALYRKRWNKAQGGWSSIPNKEDGHSEAADAIRQHAQGYHAPIVVPSLNLNRPARSWRG